MISRIHGNRGVLREYFPDFAMKKIITYCDPLLEPSHRDGSNGGHNICFHSEIRTNVSIILKNLILSGALKEVMPG